MKAVFRGGVGVGGRRAHLVGSIPAASALVKDGDWSDYDKTPRFALQPGHRLWRGGAQVSWKPCICAPPREGTERGRGMKHVWVSCRACHAQLRQTMFDEPPHDIRHHQAGV